MVAFFQSIGAPELILILAVLLLLFGARKLPDIARSFGRSTTEFKKGLKEGKAEADAEEEAGTESGATEVRAPDRTTNSQ
ncbi:MAG: twin-arginine translocase TatA/TatE family subunit [Actinomycetota bacterium]|jgi:sec-independent protein translocase protein TatA